MIKIALVGDYDSEVLAHQAIPKALILAKQNLKQDIKWQWIPTSGIQSEADFHGFSGIWCVPASPYKNMDGALLAIKFARENLIPFLGTCGGFQHALIEMARNILGLTEADHAENNPNAPWLVVTPLTCSLIEVQRAIRFDPLGTFTHWFKNDTAEEGYHCSYGMNPDIENRLEEAEFQIEARDHDGEVRAISHKNHPFFAATLFQPERNALQSILSPIIFQFVRAQT